MKKLLARLILLMMVINILPADSSMSDGVSVEYIPAAFNLGIGYLSPSSKLHVNGTTATKGFSLNGNTFSITPSLSQGSILFSKIAESFSALDNGAGSNHKALKVNGNTLVWESIYSGVGSGATNIDGLSDAKSNAYNVYLGNGAGAYPDTGTSYSTGVGIKALKNNVSASGLRNSAFGYFSLNGNTTGDDNTASGYFGLTDNTTGYSNTASGYNSLYLNTTGDYNTAVGADSLRGGTKNGHTAIGVQSLRISSSGYSSVAIGAYSLPSDTHPVGDTAIGAYSLRYIGGEAYNTAVGYQANEGAVNNNSYQAVHFGYRAGASIGTDSITYVAGNTLIGFQAGDSITSGEENIIIGYDVDTPTASSSNRINIGNTIYGNTSVVKVSIGTPNMSAHRLQVAGTAGLSTGTAWTNTSDIRLKNIDGDYEYGLAEILKLHSVRFHYKDGNAQEMPSDIPLIGFIAQEVEPIFPEAVSQAKDGYYDFNIHPISVAMVNAVQELKQETDQELQQLKISNEQLKLENEQLLSYLCAKDPVITFCPMIAFGRIN